jgi:hypothetical protein
MRFARRFRLMNGDALRAHERHEAKGNSIPRPCKGQRARSRPRALKTLATDCGNDRCSSSVNKKPRPPTRRMGELHKPLVPKG